MNNTPKSKSCLDLFLWSNVTIVATLSLSAVHGLWWKLDVTFSANHLLDLVLSGQGSERWLKLDLTHTATSKSENEMKGGLLLDVVVGESSAIFELLSSEDESLLIGWDSFLILNFCPIS